MNIFNVIVSGKSTPYSMAYFLQIMLVKIEYIFLINKSMSRLF